MKLKTFSELFYRQQLHDIIRYSEGYGITYRQLRRRLDGYSPRDNHEYYIMANILYDMWGRDMTMYCLELVESIPNQPKPVRPLPSEFVRPLPSGMDVEPQVFTRRFRSLEDLASHLGVTIKYDESKFDAWELEESQW